jgi:hypothetical protein
VPLLFVSTGIDPEGLRVNTAGCTLGASAKLISDHHQRATQAAVTFHDGVHTVRKELRHGHIEAKFEIQLAEAEGRVYNQVFLDFDQSV